MFNLGSMLNLGSTDPVIGKAHALINCSTDELFHYVGNHLFDNYPKWSPEVQELQQLTSGPVTVGTEGWQMRIDQGRRTESKFRVTAFEPGVRVTLVGISDPFRCSYEFQAVIPEQSTQLTFSFELLEILAIMRPFEALVRIAIKDGAERTVQNIKRLTEAENFTRASNP